MYLFMGGVGDIYQAMFPSLQNCIENVCCFLFFIG